MKVLIDEGYPLTTGVLNILDTDYETAKLLKIPVTAEAPFSPITEKTRKNNLAMINKASAVVVASVQFGYGNLQNLKTAKKALDLKIPVYIIDELPIERRDFTNGKATELFFEMRRKGAIFVKDQYELLKLLHISDEKLKTTHENNVRLQAHLKPKDSSKKVKKNGE